MHLRRPVFTYSTCGRFTKNKERIQKFKETGDSKYIYQNELKKLAFGMTGLMENLMIYLEEPPEPQINHQGIGRFVKRCPF